jgi:isoaspartyl peptidase/L-asparaginase-like protein (Ntn-hydrolase superfamily)
MVIDGQVYKLEAYINTVTMLEAGAVPRITIGVGSYYKLNGVKYTDATGLNIIMSIFKWFIIGYFTH